MTMFNFLFNSTLLFSTIPVTEASYYTLVYESFSFLFVLPAFFFFTGSSSSQSNQSKSSSTSRYLYRFPLYFSSNALLSTFFLPLFLFLLVLLSCIQLFVYGIKIQFRSEFADKLVNQKQTGAHQDHYNIQSMQNLLKDKTKSKSQADREKSSLENLKQLREFFRQEAEKAIRQIKDNDLLSLDEIREAEMMFDDIDETNQYLKKKNEEKRDKRQKTRTVTKDKSKPKEDSKQKEKEHEKQNQKEKAEQSEVEIEKSEEEREEHEEEREKEKETVREKQKQKEDEEKQRDQQMEVQKQKEPEKEKKNRSKKKKRQREAKKQGRMEQQPRRRQIRVAQYNQGRRWNEILENPKKGKFDPEEKQILAQSLSQYLLRNNIQLATLIASLQNEEGERIPRNLKMWTVICSALPNRTLRSTYRYLTRMLRRSQNLTKWTEEEENRLMSLASRYGNKWKLISQKLGRSADNVRDKYRNLFSKNRDRKSKFWKIQELIDLFKGIQQSSEHQFLRQGVEDLLSDAEAHNSMQAEHTRLYKYNSKFNLTHNAVNLLDYIDGNELGKVERQRIRWKSIADSLQTRTEVECKNKYLQFMEIFNKDHSGIGEAKVIAFIEEEMRSSRRRGFGYYDIDWGNWSAEEMEFNVEEAKCKWLLMKKKIRNRVEKSFADILQEAKTRNQRKVEKARRREEREQRRLEEALRRNSEQEEHQRDKQPQNIPNNDEDQDQNEDQNQDQIVIVDSADQEENKETRNKIRKTKPIKKSRQPKPTPLLELDESSIEQIRKPNFEFMNRK